MTHIRKCDWQCVALPPRQHFYTKKSNHRIYNTLFHLAISTSCFETQCRVVGLKMNVLENMEKIEFTSKCVVVENVVRGTQIASFGATVRCVVVFANVVRQKFVTRWYTVGTVGLQLHLGCDIWNWSVSFLFLQFYVKIGLLFKLTTIDTNR